MSEIFRINNRNIVDIKREPCTSGIVQRRTRDGWVLLQSIRDPSRIWLCLVGLSHHLLKCGLSGERMVSGSHNYAGKEGDTKLGLSCDDLNKYMEKTYKTTKY